MKQPVNLDRQNLIYLIKTYPEFTSSSIMKIIHEHTREAGIRNLEREIASVCRKIAAERVTHNEQYKDKKVTPEVIEQYLGPRKYYYEVADEKDRIGITTGLIWTEAGGASSLLEESRKKCWPLTRQALRPLLYLLRIK